MKIITISTIMIPTILLAGIPIAATYAAGGGAASSRPSAPSRPPKSKLQLGAERYNKGLKYRDKGNVYAEQAANADDEEKAAKLATKSDKEYKKAIKQFKRAIKYRPPMYEAHSSLGYTYRKTGQYMSHCTLTTPPWTSIPVTAKPWNTAVRPI